MTLLNHSYIFLLKCVANKKIVLNNCSRYFQQKSRRQKNESENQFNNLLIQFFSFLPVNIKNISAPQLAQDYGNNKRNWKQAEKVQSILLQGNPPNHRYYWMTKTFINIESYSHVLNLHSHTLTRKIKLNHLLNHNAIWYDTEPHSCLLVS